MNRHASGLKAVLAGLLLALTHPALAGSGANLRFEHEKRQDDGRQLESVTRVLNFGDATELRFKTTQVSGLAKVTDEYPMSSNRVHVCPPRMGVVQTCGP